MIKDEQGKLHGDDGKYRAKVYPQKPIDFSERCSGDRYEAFTYNGHKALIPNSITGLTIIEVEQSSGYPITHGIRKSIEMDAYISDDGGIAVATSDDGFKFGGVDEGGKCIGDWLDLGTGEKVNVVDGVPQVGVKATAIANGYWCDIHDEIGYPSCQGCMSEARASGLLGTERIEERR